MTTGDRTALLEDLLGQVDVVISSTGATRPVITSSLVRRAVRTRKYRPLFVVDIAVPRDVEEAVGEIDTAVPYTHLSLPTQALVYGSVVASPRNT